MDEHARHGFATARALVVDDDPLLSDLLAEWVAEKWRCETASGGAEAVDVVDDSFDVVLLDRQMPDLSGEAVLERIREDELPVQVVVISGVEPDFDVVDLPFDDYLRKPVDRPTLQAAIEGVLLRRTYHPTVQQFFVCTAKLELLESAKPAGELAGDERYLSLLARADELRQSADATLGERTEHVAGFNDVSADD